MRIAAVASWSRVSASWSWLTPWSRAASRTSSRKRSRSRSRSRAGSPEPSVSRAHSGTSSGAVVNPWSGPAAFGWVVPATRPPSWAVMSEIPSQTALGQSPRAKRSWTSSWTCWAIRWNSFAWWRADVASARAWRACSFHSWPTRRNSS